MLTIGMVNDMYAESSNDEYKGYAQIATQKGFDAYSGKSERQFRDIGTAFRFKQNE